MLKRIITSTWYAFATIIILLAIFVGIVREFPELYQKYLPKIENNLTTLIGKPVKINAITINWYGYTPLITADRIEIFTEDKTQQLFYAREADISINLFKSLFTKKVSIQHITVIDSNLDAVRTIDQKLLLNGIDISEKVAQRKKIEDKQSIRFRLLDSSISINDEVNQLNYFFDQVNVILDFEKNRFKIAADISLPEKLGRNFSLLANIKNFEKGLGKGKGDLYIKGEQINLELISDFFPQLKLGIDSGTSSFEAWGDITSATDRVFVGNLSLTNLKYKPPEKQLFGLETNSEITSIKTKFNIKNSNQDWVLNLIESVVEAEDEQWLGEKYEIACIECKRENYIMATSLDYLNAKHIFSTLQHFPVFNQHLEDLYSKATIEGVLEDTKFIFAIKEKKLDKYLLETSLNNAQLTIPGKEFKLSNLSGLLKGNHTKGEFSINSNTLYIKAKRIFANELDQQSLAGKVKWKNELPNYSIYFENLELQTINDTLDFQGSLQMQNEQFYLDIQASAPLITAATFNKLIPHKILKPKLSRWLQHSIVDGEAKQVLFLFRGNPKHTPFKTHPGVVKLYTKIENATLDYKVGWPIISNINAELEINNKNFSVIGNQAKLLNTSINNAVVTINDLKLPRLVINGETTGPTNDYLEYLRESALLPENSEVHQHLSVDGQSQLDLEIALTITKKLEKERRVNGHAKLSNNNLTINTLTLPFKNISGEIYFDRNGAEFTNVTANLFEQKFVANAKKLDGGKTSIQLDGKLEIDSYISNNPAVDVQFFTGIIPVEAEIILPGFGKRYKDKSLAISINSELQGASIDLPEPFYKTAPQIIPFNFSAVYVKKEMMPINISIDDRLFIDSIFDNSVKQLTAVELNTSQSHSSIPNEGIRIAGEFDEIDLSAWLKVTGQEDRSDNELELNEIDIRANKILYSGQEFQNIGIQINKTHDLWKGAIDSTVAKGSFEIPIYKQTKVPITANFDYLKFKKNEHKEMKNFDPRKLPEINLNAKHFEYDGIVFKDIDLITTPIAQGINIQSLTGKGDDLQLNAHGSWVVDSVDNHKSSITFTLKSEHLENSLKGLGFGSQVTNGEGRISGSFNWPNPPYRFSLESITGTTKVRLNDGQFSTVDQGGAGRLLGLFNFGEISRRLSLDFSDFFSKGYTFDKIRGDLNFGNSNLTTENLTIKGSSADILIQGTTELATRNYDQIITVTPHVTGGLPWIGFAVGGPIGGVGVMVADKLAKTVGINLNRVTEVQYTLTGSWDDPKVEPLSQKVIQANSNGENTNVPTRTLPQYQPIPSNTTDKSTETSQVK